MADGGMEDSDSESVAESCPHPRGAATDSSSCCGSSACCHDDEEEEEMDEDDDGCSSCVDTSVKEGIKLQMYKLERR